MEFDISAVSRYTGGKRNIRYVDVTGSTNLDLISDVKNGVAGIGDILAAGSQSDGRGRFGKSFLSPAGGIYASFCVNNKDGDIPTVICGVAVAEVLTELGLSPEIKWVNDILLGGKKVCGILAQAVSGTSVAVIGFGINLHGDSIPPEISNIATALDLHTEKQLSKEELIGRITSGCEKLEKLTRHEIIEKYKSYLRLLGKDIQIVSTGERCRAVDVTENGELSVEKNDGSLILLSSGEISILKAY